VTTVGDPRWQPVRKLDARAMTELVAETTGLAFEFLGRAPGGEVGAGYVRWPDGRPAVLTFMPGSGGRGRVEEIAGMLAVAGAHGVPVPEYQLVVEIPEAIVVLQERLPGDPPDRLDRPLVDRMVALNERLAGLLAGTGFPTAELFLERSGPGFCLHEPLAGYDADTAKVLDWIREVGRSVPPRMTGDDLVHLDYHHKNVLVGGDGEITGVIDWDGAHRGDRRFDLVTMRFSTEPADHELAAHLDGLLADRLTEDELRPYWAHMSLRLIDWSIRHHTAAEVDRYVALANLMVA
jgi:Ser/Thr protein kinase RdoA (MazF antagonist)